MSYIDIFIFFRSVLVILTVVHQIFNLVLIFITTLNKTLLFRLHLLNQLLVLVFQIFDIIAF